MITLPRPLLRQIENAAEAAYPHECCGLLIGHNATVSSIAESPNSTQADKATRFEVDPQLRFNLMRELKGSGEDIIGHYHSHPDKPAEPSEHDQKMALEPDLTWLIISVINGKAAETRAYRVDKEGNDLKEIPLSVVG